MRQALAVLQLAELPGGMAELRNLVGEVHPNPWKTWTWAHTAAYQRILPLVMAIGRGKAAEARKQRHG